MMDRWKRLRWNQWQRRHHCLCGSGIHGKNSLHCNLNSASPSSKSANPSSTSRKWPSHPLSAARNRLNNRPGVGVTRSIRRLRLSSCSHNHRGMVQALPASHLHNRRPRRSSMSILTPISFHSGHGARRHKQGKAHNRHTQHLQWALSK
jgi:hypothetical protein